MPVLFIQQIHHFHVWIIQNLERWCQIQGNYKPPNRQEIRGILHIKVHESVMQTYKDDLKGQVICVAFDGWSKVHKEQIVGMTISQKG